MDSIALSTTATSTVVILTTVPGDFDGAALGRRLVDEGLAACVNVLPAMTSVYRWKGVCEEATERQLVIKTRGECVDALYARLITLHPYEVPEFLVLPVSGGSPAYLEWVRDSVREPA